MGTKKGILNLEYTVICPTITIRIVSETNFIVTIERQAIIHQQNQSLPVHITLKPLQFHSSEIAQETLINSQQQSIQVSQIAEWIKAFIDKHRWDGLETYEEPEQPVPE